jgi:hypothetical protein
MSDTVPICQPKSLPSHLVIPAARVAAALNPANAPAMHPEAYAHLDVPPSALSIAVLTTKRWPASGVHLTVGFMDPIKPALRDRIMGAANQWGRYANVGFGYTAAVASADVRVTSRPDGFWSYLGTDILSIPRDLATMCLEDYLDGLPDSEFDRVPPHEFAHTLSAVHSQARRSIISRLDRLATLAYYRRTQGWSEDMVIAQVLTPLEESELIGTADPASDEDSIMTYPFPSECTIDHRPIVGGTHITEADGRLMGQLYPLANSRPLSSDQIVQALAGIL